MSEVSEGWFAYEKRNDYVDYLVGLGLFVFLCYMFFGIAVASDIFMNAIEKICGSTRVVKTTREEDGVIIVDTKEVQVWNDTIANLSLMALGSSAPEILLSVIEISQGLGKQSPGDLGPGTIVGSAAFNLLIISAVCILSVPKGGTSRIKIYQVFVVTSVTSLFAYIWMVVVLYWSSPDVVEVWEAVVTLVMFVLLLVISYWADQEFCLRGNKRKSSVASDIRAADEEQQHYVGYDQERLYDDDGNVDKVALQNLYHKLTEIADLTPEEIASILATKLIQEKQHSRMWYRMQASRGLMGGAKLMPVLNDKLKEVVDVINDAGHGVRSSFLKTAITDPEVYKSKAVVDFQAAALAVSEGVGEFAVTVNRTGKEDIGFSARVDSSDGSAKKGKEYEAVSKLLKFDPYVMENTFKVKVIDNVQWNPDSNFYLRLSIPAEFQDKAAVGQTKVMEIIIEDDDKPGKLSFTKKGYVLDVNTKLGYVEVERIDGSDGIISATWTVTPRPKCTLIDPDLTGKIEFQHGELKKFIEIKIHPHTGKVEGNDETFDVELSSPQGGAKLGKIPKTTCAISGDEKFKLELTNAMNLALEMNEESEQDVSYKDQILQALYVNGGDTKNATTKDWALHILTFPFKFTFALIPPPYMAGGWLCFFSALAAVGILTKIVGDAAGTFGFAIGMDPVITAMTFVALGTSLPDTFASRIAAMNDKTADNAIGNVTGSNSVNVFLGLGIPWTIGAIYYKHFHTNVHDDTEPFCVPAGSLTFNVLVFSVTAFISLFILTCRRYSSKCGNAELGGPSGTKWITASAMIVLWFLYIAMSSVQVIMAKNGNDFTEVLTGSKTFSSRCEILVERYKNCSGSSSCPNFPDPV